MKYGAEQRILIHDICFKVSVMEKMGKQASQKFSLSLAPSKATEVYKTVAQKGKVR